MDCPYCERSLHVFSVRCRVCDRFVPRWPHLIFIGLVVISFLAGIVLVLEFLAKSR